MVAVVVVAVVEVVAPGGQVGELALAAKVRLLYLFFLADVLRTCVFVLVLQRGSTLCASLRGVSHNFLCCWIVACYSVSV